MTDVGRHSPPIDGTVTANGHQLVPLVMPQLATRGDVSALLRQDSGERTRTAANERERRRWHADGDTVIRVLAAIVVLAVAAFAAIVSYSHIFELGVLHHQIGTAARLLPLSVDGLIASASLVMLHAARRELAVPWLARAMLALGVGATVAANVGYGLPFGWLSAVVSAWPAVAFVGSVEMAVRFVRDARHDGGSDTADDAPVVTPRHDSDHDKKDDKPARKPVARKRAPAVTNKELADRAGVSVRTLQRRRNESRP
jgi:hypothetical protein